MAKIGLSNTIPPLPFPPFPIPGIGITHPKENIQRKHLPGELQGGHGCSKSGDKERCSSHLPLEGRPGPQQMLMKAGSEWNAYTLQAKRCKRERAKSMHTCVCVHACTMTFFPTTPSENIIFLHEK